MINFQDEMQNLAKFTHFEKFIFIRKWLTRNMWLIGATIYILNNKLQKISFKNYFVKFLFFIFKNSQSSYKIIPLAPMYVLAPSHHNQMSKVVTF
jgi:hypothetical protein